MLITHSATQGHDIRLSATVTFSLSGIYQAVGIQNVISLGCSESCSYRNGRQKPPRLATQRSGVLAPPQHGPDSGLGGRASTILPQHFMFYWASLGGLLLCSNTASKLKTSRKALPAGSLAEPRKTQQQKEKLSKLAGSNPNLLVCSHQQALGGIVIHAGQLADVGEKCVCMQQNALACPHKAQPTTHNISVALQLVLRGGCVVWPW